MIHEQLKQAREQKGWSLDELSRRAGLRPRTIELIDRGEFAELPAGLYCRSSIRSYAVAVGLNPDEIIEALRPLLPSAEDPLDGLARRCGHARKAEKVHEPLLQSQPPIVEPRVMNAVDARVDLLVASGDAAEVAPPAAWPQEALLRLTIAPPDAEVSDLIFEHATARDEPATSPRMTLEPAGEAARQWWRPLAASGIDLLVLAVIGFALVWLTARVGATTVPLALRSGAPGISLVFALIVSLYFVLFGGVGNATPGGWLMRLEERPSGRTVLNPRAVFGRACRSIYRDPGLLADLSASDTR